MHGSRIITGPGLFVFAVLTSACATTELLSDAVPRISDFQSTVPAPFGTESAQLELTATYTLGYWSDGQTEKAFGYSREEIVQGQVVAPTRGPGATIFTDNDLRLTCQPLEANREICTVIVTVVEPGTYRYQWFFIRADAGVGEESLIEAPLPYGTFTVTQNQIAQQTGTGPAPPPPPPQPPPDPPELVAFEPEDGDSCAGVLEYGNGFTLVAIRWGLQGDAVMQSRPGDYQVVVESSQGLGCAVPEVNLDNPGEGVFTPTCKVQRHHHNDFAMDIETGQSHRWRVRSIRAATLAHPLAFGPWTNWWTFGAGTSNCISP